MSERVASAAQPSERWAPDSGDFRRTRAIIWSALAADGSAAALVATGGVDDPATAIRIAFSLWCTGWVAPLWATSRGDMELPPRQESVLDCF